LRVENIGGHHRRGVIWMLRQAERSDKSEKEGRIQRREKKGHA